jgi:PAS domain S-box-containing protein
MNRSMDMLHARLRAFTLVAAFAAMSVSGGVLLGWALGIPWILDLSPRFVTMKPVTALCFFLSGLSLFLLAPESSLTALRRRLAQFSASLVVVAGIATILEFALSLDLHFESFFFQRALLSTGISDPGRISLPSATAFVCLGIGLIFLDYETPAGTRPAQFFSGFVVLVALLNCLGYLYGVDDLYRAFHQNSMAIHTALLFLLLGTAAIVVRPDRGYVAVFNGRHAGSTMARSVLPSAVIFTILLGGLRLLGERLGFYGTSFGIALFATSNIAVFATLLWFSARSLNASAQQLEAAARDLALSNERANQTRSRLAAIVESSDDAIISKNLNGVITSWNAGAQRIFGYSPEETIGKPMLMLFPPDRVAEESNILRRLANGESIVPFESVRVRKDGTHILVSITLSPLRDSSGAVVGASKIARDITEPRRIEHVIEENEARLAAVIASTMDAVIAVNEQQYVTIFNPAAEKMFLCSAADAIATPLDRFIPRRFRQEHARHIHAFGETHTTRRSMGRMGSLYALRSDGLEFPIEASISHTEVHGQKLFTVIIRDITERKRVEDVFRQQASLLDLAPVMVRDLDSRIVLWTRGAQQLYGYSKPEAMGQVSHELLQTQYPAPPEQIEETLRREGTWEGELTHRGRDGQLVTVVSQWVLHYDEMGKPVRILEVNADVTESKRAHTNQLRSQKLESLGTLAGGVAHDFNNILAAINGNAKMALDDLPPDHPVRPNLSEITKAGARAADLVRRILAFSRPQEQKREPQPVQPVVEEALKLVRATLPAAIQIETHFAANLPWVSVDATQIHQIIVNLTTNAGHAIGNKPGTITVRLIGRTMTPDDLRVTPDLKIGLYVCLSVSDDGCGMDRATLDRVFDPFFTTKPFGQGTGLGLSVVHGIVSGYGGAISVYSQPGQGTSFHLYFPAAAASASASTPAQAPSAKAGHHESILYVDDEEGLVMLGTIFLRRLGYQVTGHVDAAAALDDFRSRPNHFDALVTDLSMPHMSGFDLARQLLALRPGLPIIMASGYVRPEDQRAAEALGINRIILKPSTIDALGQALDEVLRSKVPAVSS